MLDFLFLGLGVWGEELFSLAILFSLVLLLLLSFFFFFFSFPLDCCAVFLGLVLSDSAFSFCG